MNASFELSTSVWGKSANVQDAPALSSDASADVVVVGAGLAGLSVAYELARAAAPSWRSTAARSAEA